MTRLRTRLVCGSRLGEFAEKLGLQEFAVKSKYVEQVNNGRKNHKILEDIFEAFIGAMFEDNAVDRSAATYGAALSKDMYASRLYYNNTDANLVITHNQPTGTVSMGFFGTSTAFANLYLSTGDSRSVFTAGYGSYSSNLSVTGLATITSNIYIGGSGSVSNDFAVSTNLMVGGASTLTGNLNVLSSGIFGTDLTVAGTTAIGTNLTVGNCATCTISGSAAIGTNLVVGATSHDNR